MGESWDANSALRARLREGLSPTPPIRANVPLRESGISLPQAFLSTVQTVAKLAPQIFLDVAPGSGDFLAARDSALHAEMGRRALTEGDLGSAAGHYFDSAAVALGALPLIPSLGKMGEKVGPFYSELARQWSAFRQSKKGAASAMQAKDVTAILGKMGSRAERDFMGLPQMLARHNPKDKIKLEELDRYIAEGNLAKHVEVKTLGGIGEKRGTGWRAPDVNWLPAMTRDPDSASHLMSIMERRIGSLEPDDPHRLQLEQDLPVLHEALRQYDPLKYDPDIQRLRELGENYDLVALARGDLGPDYIKIQDEWNAVNERLLKRYPDASVELFSNEYVTIDLLEDLFERQRGANDPPKFETQHQAPYGDPAPGQYAEIVLEAPHESLKPLIEAGQMRGEGEKLLNKWQRAIRDSFPEKEALYAAHNKEFEELADIDRVINERYWNTGDKERRLRARKELDSYRQWLEQEHIREVVKQDLEYQKTYRSDVDRALDLKHKAEEKFLEGRPWPGRELHFGKAGQGWARVRAAELTQGGRTYKGWYPFEVQSDYTALAAEEAKHGRPFPDTPFNKRGIGPAVDAMLYKAAESGAEFIAIPRADKDLFVKRYGVNSYDEVVELAKRRLAQGAITQEEHDQIVNAWNYVPAVYGQKGQLAQQIKQRLKKVGVKVEAIEHSFQVPHEQGSVSERGWIIPLKRETREKILQKGFKISKLSELAQEALA